MRRHKQYGMIESWAWVGENLVHNLPPHDAGKFDVLEAVVDQGHLKHKRQEIKKPGNRTTCHDCGTGFKGGEM